MTRYYADKLSAERLKAVYDLAPSATQNYLEAEIQFVQNRVSHSISVLELGCGYGRVLQRLLPVAGRVTGIDNSTANIEYAVDFLRGDLNSHLAVMDAAELGFQDRVFDLTICLQNGICAFRVGLVLLLKEALRVTRSGGMVLFSSYAERFWPHRLEWFEIQVAHGLLGPIDYEATNNGVIACKDGFRSGTMRREDFNNMAARLGLSARITEVAGSSLFCEIVV